MQILVDTVSIKGVSPDADNFGLATERSVVIAIGKYIGCNIKINRLNEVYNSGNK